MKNQVIKVLNADHGKKVIEYWKSLGIETDYQGQCSEETNDYMIYYGVINDLFDNYDLVFVQRTNAEIIELPEEKTFPRKMLVWAFHEIDAQEALVFMKLPGNHESPWIGMATCCSNYNNYLEDKPYTVTCYPNAKEIEVSDVEEMSMEEVCAALGKIIKIVKK
jgi:hypothetical protein